MGDSQPPQTEEEEGTTVIFENRVETGTSGGDTVSSGGGGGGGSMTPEDYAARAEAEAAAKRQAEEAEQAQRDADAEAQRQAEEQAAQEAEAQRNADAEAAVEAQRQADLEAQRQADLEAQRQADYQAAAFNASSSSEQKKIGTTPPRNDAELAAAQRLARGEGSPQEALNYFQQHGHSELSDLPTWDPGQGLWAFPGPSGSGSPGPALSGETGGSVPGGGAGPAGGTGSGNGAGSSTTLPGSLGASSGGDSGASSADGKSGADNGTDKAGAPSGGGQHGSGSGSGVAGAGDASTTGTPVSVPAPAGGASPPPPPVPGSPQAAYNEAFAVGQLYGRFRSDYQSMMSTLQTKHSGVSVWDRMSSQERSDIAHNAKSRFDALPKLPHSSDPAIEAARRDGFTKGAGAGYDAARFEALATWAALEIAQLLVLGRVAGAPAVSVGINAAMTSREIDCAAHTAARILREVHGFEVSAAELRAIYGLPASSSAGFTSARTIALNWFNASGIRLSPRPVDLERMLFQGTPGKFVVFMRGVANGEGHVIYGEISGGKLTLIDDQIGKTWTTVSGAQNALQMELGGVYQIEVDAVQVP